METFRQKLVVFFFKYLFWVVKVWYSITMFFTKQKVNMTEYTSVKEIAAALHFGVRYKQDPLKGKFDIMYHPTKVQQNIDLGVSIGDCDDHAIYWVTSLLKNNLACKCWLGTIQYKETLSGHMFCIFQDVKGDYYWCDYNYPVKMDKLENWPSYVSILYGKTFLVGGTIEVKGLKADDTPIFGKTKTYLKCKFYGNNLDKKA